LPDARPIWRQRPPRDLRAVRYAVCVLRAALHQVPDDAVRVVARLAARPMERLSGVVLVVAGLGESRDLDQRGREVVENAGADWCRLALAGIGRKREHHVLMRTALRADWPPRYARRRAYGAPRYARRYRIRPRPAEM